MSPRNLMNLMLHPKIQENYDLWDTHDDVINVMNESNLIPWLEEATDGKSEYIFVKGVTCIANDAMGLLQLTRGAELWPL